ncbi:MAG: ABC transporter ATP-binding protein [Candidatus Woesearchaeota archaeon]|nr:ABC transporter ATP-binding protein [Candidatus Woesearchaeota archaeon]
MAKPVIELRDVWKTYKMGDTNVDALRGMSLKIYEGEFVAIMGPSGSGKSTTMNMIGCLDVPTKGHIFLDSQDVSRMTESTLARIRGRKVGFIFQQFNLISAFNAKENVMLPMMFQDIPREEQSEKAEALLEMVGMLKRMAHKPSELSGGEQQRIAIARALANDPQMILADEPTGNLDSKTGNEILTLIKKLNEVDGKTIVLVTHDKGLAQKYAKRIVQIKDGQII